MLLGKTAKTHIRTCDILKKKRSDAPKQMDLKRLRVESEDSTADDKLKKIIFFSNILIWLSRMRINNNIK